MATFAQWTDRLKVYVDLLKADGERRKSLAEAALIDAQTQGQLVKVRAMQRLLKELNRELSAILRTEQRTKKKITKIKGDARLITKLLGGRSFDATQFSRSRSLFRKYLETVLLEDFADSLYDLELPQSATAGSNYVRCTHRSREPVGVPGTITGVLEFSDWMLSEGQIPKTGKPAQRSFRKLVQAIDDVAGQSTAELRTVLDDIQNNRLDKWKDKFDFFDDTPAVKK